MKTKTGTLIATGLLTLFQSVGAAGPADYFSANLSLVSDYVWRGSSQTDEDPAVQGGIDFKHPVGIYVGTWASNIDFPDVVGDRANIEVDFYGGYTHDFGNGFGADIGLIYYWYPRTEGLNWLEGYLKGSWSKGGLEFGASVNYSNNAFDSDESGTYYDASIGYTLDKAGKLFSSPGLSAGVGYYNLDKGVFGTGAPDSYETWNAGGFVDLAGFTVDARYYDTDRDGRDLFGDNGGSRFVISVSRSF